MELLQIFLQLLAAWRNSFLQLLVDLFPDAFGFSSLNKEREKIENNS